MASRDSLSTESLYVVVSKHTTKVEVSTNVYSVHRTIEQVSFYGCASEEL